MKMVCPSCRAAIDPGGLNVLENLALCSGCGEVFKLSEVIRRAGEVAGKFDPSHPPQGVIYTRHDQDARIEASTQSWAAVFLVPFACVWSGAALMGIYGTQFMEGSFNLVLSLFGLPFVGMSLLFGAFALMMVRGRVVVTILGDDCTIFIGLGSYGWTRRIDWRRVVRVEEQIVVYNQRGGASPAVALVGPSTTIRFGTLLNRQRRSFMIEALSLHRRREEKAAAPMEEAMAN